MIRISIKALAFAALAIASGGPVHSQGATPAQANRDYMQRVLERLPGANPVNVCFARRYDAAHLARYPKQKVTQMIFLLHAFEIAGDNGAAYPIVIGVTLRGRKGVYNSDGSCGVSRDESGGAIQHLRCGIDGDGGSFNVELANGDKSLLVRLERGISINRPGTNENPDEPPVERDGLKAGTDDKVFRIDRVSTEECARLFPDRKAFREYLEMH